MAKSKFILTLAVVAVAFVILMSVFTGAFHSYSISGGYSSAFEGPKAKFYGVTYNGQQYTNTKAPNASSLHQFDTVMHFDADAIDDGKPKIHGEMTTVFLPEDTSKNLVSWLPTPWIQNNGLINNPEKTYAWNVSNYMYKMDQYRMRYYVTFSAEWAPGGSVWEKHETALPRPGENSYTDAQAWIELDLSPTWYIEGGGTAYFAIGKMQLAEDAIFAGRDTNNKATTARGTVSVSPESRSSPVYLYYQPFGSQAADTQTANTYQGKQLNPSYFRDKVYLHIDFNKFGVYSGINYVFWAWDQGDVVTLAFDMTVFVIGQYQVKDIQQDPTQYGRFTPTDNTTPSFLDWLFNSPAGLAFLTLLIVAIVVVIIIVLVIFFAPGVLIAFAALLGGRKKG